MDHYTKHKLLQLIQTGLVITAIGVLIFSVAIATFEIRKQKTVNYGKTELIDNPEEKEAKENPPEDPPEKLKETTKEDVQEERKKEEKAEATVAVAQPETPVSPPEILRIGGIDISPNVMKDIIEIVFKRAIGGMFVIILLITSSIVLLRNCTVAPRISKKKGVWFSPSGYIVEYFSPTPDEELNDKRTMIYGGAFLAIILLLLIVVI